jgi:hypothetical protein
MKAIRLVIGFGMTACAYGAWGQSGVAPELGCALNERARPSRADIQFRREPLVGRSDLETICHSDRSRRDTSRYDECRHPSITCVRAFDRKHVG